MRVVDDIVGHCGIELFCGGSTFPICLAVARRAKKIGLKSVPITNTTVCMAMRCETCNHLTNTCVARQRRLRLEREPLSERVGKGDEAREVHWRLPFPSARELVVLAYFCRRANYLLARGRWGGGYLNNSLDPPRGSHPRGASSPRSSQHPSARGVPPRAP
eukprot:6102368-Pleurochrysis_carterae.AAC.1